MTIEIWMLIIWFSVFVLGILIELFTEEIFSIWFSIGAALAFILALIPNVVWWVQLIVFLVVTALSILILRPLTKKWMKRSDRQTNIDNVIGKKGKIIREVTPLDYGEVKIHGVIWTAISHDSKKTIDDNTIVEVVAIEGNKVVVKPFEENEKEKNK